MLKLARMYNIEDFQFLVVGNYSQDVKQDNVTFTGPIYDRSLLANVYTQADIALGFSKSESFGMTCVEALCCGTPFVGFKCGGTESIAIEEFTRFVDYGDVNSMAESIKEITEKMDGKKAYISEISRDRFSRERMAKKYYDLYKELVNAKRKKGAYENT